MPPRILQIASVSLAGSEVQNAMALIDQTQALGDKVVTDQVFEAFRAVEAVPGILQAEDAIRIRDLLQAGNAPEAFRHLDAYREVLLSAQEQCRAAGETTVAAESLPPEQIANMLGLPSQDFVERRWNPSWPVLHRSGVEEPLAPVEARRIEVVFSEGDARPFQLTQEGRLIEIKIGRGEQPGQIYLKDPRVSEEHAKIILINGQYLLQDCGSMNGTSHNGRQLAPSELTLLNDGDRIQLGICGIVVRLPDMRPQGSVMEQVQMRLTERLNEASSFAQILTALEENGFGAIVPKIAEVLSFPLLIDERLAQLRRATPSNAGLLFKLESLVLQHGFIHLRNHFFPQLTLPNALKASEMLVQRLERARTFRDLAEHLRSTNVEAFREWIEKIERLSSGKPGSLIPLGDFPKIFGLRDQVTRLFLEVQLPDQEQRDDLKWRGVTPDLLLERPWRRLMVPPLLKEALEAFRGDIGKRLDLHLMEATLVTAFGDEREEPSSVVSEPARFGQTGHILYDRYEAKNPTPSQSVGSATGSGEPGFFGEILERLLKDGIVIPHNGWFFGGTFSPKERYEGRIYLSLRRHHAEEIFRYLHGIVEPALKVQGGVIEYKIAGVPEGYERSDSGVIYFHAKNQEAIWKAVRAMQEAHPEFFKKGHPLFTMPLRDENGQVLTGLSFGEHPKSEEVSFGMLRTNSLTAAIRTARALLKTTEPPDWEEITQICAYFLRRAGVDIDDPAFNADGRSKFPFIISPTLRAEQPLAMEEAALKDLVTAELVQELREAYGYFRGSDPRREKQVTAAAKAIYRRWDKKGRPLPEGSPAHVPERFVDRVMDLIKTHYPDVAKEIAESYEGNRAQRETRRR